MLNADAQQNKSLPTKGCGKSEAQLQVPDILVTPGTGGHMARVDEYTEDCTHLPELFSQSLEVQNIEYASLGGEGNIKPLVGFKIPLAKRLEA